MRENTQPRQKKTKTRKMCTSIVFMGIIRAHTKHMVFIAAAFCSSVVAFPSSASALSTNTFPIRHHHRCCYHSPSSIVYFYKWRSMKLTWSPMNYGPYVVHSHICVVYTMPCIRNRLISSSAVFIYVSILHARMNSYLWYSAVGVSMRRLIIFICSLLKCPFRYTRICGWRIYSSIGFYHLKLGESRVLSISVNLFSVFFHCARHIQSTRPRFISRRRVRNNGPNRFSLFLDVGRALDGHIILLLTLAMRTEFYCDTQIL